MYTQFYNFSEKPFNLTPDPKFLYLTPSHREALASMVYGINERKGFISITGEVGVGKTTLVYTLLNNLNEKVKTAFVYHTSATFEQLLSYILMDLNITSDSKDKIILLGKLNEYLTKNISQDETLAIIIDEAQNLPDKLMEEFRLLSNLETSKQKLLQILLVGQPELEEKLNSQDLRQLKQRIGIRRRIKPLNPKEREEYIDHRLKIVGSSSKEVFSSDAITAICKFSEGIPRVINIICDNSLLIGYGLSQKKISGKIVKEAIEDLSDRRGDTGNSLITPPLVIPPEKAFSRKTLVFFVSSVVLFIALIFFFLTNRDDLSDSSTHEKVVRLTQIAPETTSIPSDSQQKKQHEPPQNESLEKNVTQREPAKVTRSLSEAAPPKVKNFKTVLLKEQGGSLYSIALNNYRKANTTIYDLILRANPDITNIREIPDNQAIVLPNITRESFILETSNDGYQIYIGTFETRSLAKDCLDKLTQLGEKATIQDHKFSPLETWYRVILGNFKTKREALETLSLLVKEAIISLP